MKTFVREYHNPHNAWAYGSKHTLNKHYKTAGGAKLPNIDKLLSRLETYTTFKQFRKARKYNPIYVRAKRELFQADVIFFTHNWLVKANYGYKYLLVIIDCGSKYSWCYPIRSLKCDAHEIVNKFKQTFATCGTLPAKLQTDRGGEFRCKELAQLLSSLNIHHYYSYSDNKSCIAERFNLTLQSLLYKIMEYTGSFAWSKFLPHALKIYHNRYHRTIKMSPNEAEKDTSQSKLNKIHSARYDKIKRVKPKFKRGQTVRIATARTRFKRGYMKNFNTEVFWIDKVLTNQPIPRYSLRDRNGAKIIGNFAPNEITRYERLLD